MNYQAALDYLYSFLDRTHSTPQPLAQIVPRTAALLRLVGEPQRQFQSIIIAGTKGKGSTAAMSEAILRAAGYRTGLWSSPHLHSYRERIQVDRQLISRDSLVALVADLQPQLAHFDRINYGEPTTFQVGFALALRYFADCGIDMAVLEVGLGGRYDPANVITPLASLITSISYDHTDVLGETLAQIASEKAGILKPGIPAICVPQRPEAAAVIEQTAAAVGTPLWLASYAGLTPWVPPDPLAEPGDLSGFVPADQHPTPHLPGRFQRENARLAAATALVLRGAGLALSDLAIQQGLAHARWPGRMEIVPGTPPVVLDGAHNGDSAEKLVQALGDICAGQHPVFVVGATEGKDVSRILAALAQVAAAFVLTRSQHPRALTDLDALAAQTAAASAAAGRNPPIRQANDPPLALALARSLAGPAGLVCMTGSLFVVAAGREALGLAAEQD